MSNNNTEKDKKVWQTFISGNEKLFDKDKSFVDRKSFKLRSIDLHGYNLEEANSFIENFILKSYQENINKLIVVTGKGLHSQNEKTPMFQKI